MLPICSDHVPSTYQHYLVTKHPTEVIQNSLLATVSNKVTREMTYLQFSISPCVLYKLDKLIQLWRRSVDLHLECVALSELVFEML